MNHPNLTSVHMHKENKNFIVREFRGKMIFFKISDFLAHLDEPCKRYQTK